MTLTDPPKTGEEGNIPRDAGYVSQVPSTPWIVIGRLVVVATVVIAVHFALQEWYGATLAATMVGVAWLLGRID
jgi:hypothetical protein